jgi:hypothetical protein
MPTIETTHHQPDPQGFQGVIRLQSLPHGLEQFPMEPPLIRVLITVYVREKYFPAIDSVMAQTFTDSEFIIVGDCSRDRSVEIARSYDSKPRVCIHLNQHKRSRPS